MIKEHKCIYGSLCSMKMIAGHNLTCSMMKHLKFKLAKRIIMTLVSKMETYFRVTYINASNEKYATK